jgi:hypothetical protein
VGGGGGVAKGTNEYMLGSTEAKSKEKYGVWYPIPGLTITSPYVHSRVDSNTFTMGIRQPYARVDFIPQSGTLDLDSVILNF